MERGGGERAGCGMEVTWGWVLWYSWLASFNAQPVSCGREVVSWTTGHEFEAAIHMGEGMSLIPF